MPRSPRLDIPGILQHVICRGIERSAIFKDEKDYRELLKRLAKLAGGEEIAVYAFCFMPNHVHLLVRPLNLALSTFMRRLLTGYAIYFNRRHKRAGHLFQNRYKSFLVEEDTYFLELVRYIHLNPVRTGIVSDVAGLSLYPYTGHTVFMGKARCPFIETEYVLSHFAGTVKTARTALVAFMHDGYLMGKRDDLVGGGLKRSLAGLAPTKTHLRQAYDRRVLGSGHFVEAIMQELEQKSRVQPPIITFEEFLGTVAKQHSITIAELCSGSKRSSVTKARADAVCRGTKEFGLSPTKLASILSVGSSAVCNILQRNDV